MAVLAVLSTPNTDGSPDSTPRRLVSELPAIEIDVIQFERNGNIAIPHFWMRGVPPAKFESVLSNDPQVSHIQQLERSEDGAFYKFEWTVDSPVIHCLESTNGVVIQARGIAEEWRLKIWFENGNDASTFQQCCRTRGIPLIVLRLASLADILSDGLTMSRRQHEAILLAYREGYFNEPRRVSQAELAEQLGISSSAFGRRLRRGFNSLIEAKLID